MGLDESYRSIALNAIAHSIFSDGEDEIVITDDQMRRAKLAVERVFDEVVDPVFSDGFDEGYEVGVSEPLWFPN